MVYSSYPPYELLCGKSLPFDEMQQLRRFSRHWDLVGNSGNFVESVSLIWSRDTSPFRAFMRWSTWLHERLGRNHGIALASLAEYLFTYLAEELGLDPHTVANAIYRDYQSGGRSDKPALLRPYLPADTRIQRPVGEGIPLKRQSRHLASALSREETAAAPQS